MKIKFGLFTGVGKKGDKFPDRAVKLCSPYINLMFGEKTRLVMGVRGDKVLSSRIPNQLCFIRRTIVPTVFS
jgi:hypothetical protein